MVFADNILLVSYYTFTAKNGLPFCKGGSSESRKPPSFFLIGFMPYSLPGLCRCKSGQVTLRCPECPNSHHGSTFVM